MSWSVERITEPETLPVTLDEAKEHLRVTHDEEDLLIDRLIRAATEDAETFQGRSYITRTLRLYLDRFPGAAGVIYLPMPPAASVETVTYRNHSGGEHVIEADRYVMDLARSPGRIAPAPGHSWPAVSLLPVGAVSVTYRAGYGDGPEAVPDAIRQAILLTVGHLYENREAVTTERTPAELPMGVKHLLTKGRVFVPLMSA